MNRTVPDRLRAGEAICPYNNTDPLQQAVNWAMSLDRSWTSENMGYPQDVPRFRGWIVLVQALVPTDFHVHLKIRCVGSALYTKRRYGAPTYSNGLKLIGLAVLELRFACQVEWVFLPACYCPDTCQDFSCFHFRAQNTSWIQLVGCIRLLNFIE